MSGIPLRAAIADIIDSSEVRKVLAYPRMTPRIIRNEISEIIAEELTGEHIIRDHINFQKRYGPLLNVIIVMRASPKWASLRTMAVRGGLMPAIILRMLLPAIFDITDAYFASSEKNDTQEGAHTQTDGSGAGDEDECIDGTSEKVSKKLDETESEMNADVKAMDLLSLIFPGNAFDLSLRELHKEFLSNIELYSSLVSKNDDLARIVDIVGRMESELGSLRTEKTKHGHSEVHSVRFSGDLQRMLPHETVNLTDPQLEMAFYSRFSEKKLMTYDLKGREKVSGPPKNIRKGPVVMLVDTSGSMYGEPELIAKAVSLTVAKRMIPEKRDVRVILFSTSTAEISLTSKEKMGREFLEFLSYTFGGGTDFNLALREGMRALREKEWEGADLMFISDGHSIISDHMITEEWNLLKEMNDARVFSVIINNDDAGGLEELSDSIYIMNRETMQERGGGYMNMFSDLM